MTTPASACTPSGKRRHHPGNPQSCILQAQQRLGHAEASTTLRQYCHALPLHDRDVADHHLDQLLTTDA